MVQPTHMERAEKFIARYVATYGEKPAEPTK